MAVTLETGFNTTLNQSLKSDGTETSIILATLPQDNENVVLLGSGTNLEWVSFTGIDVPTSTITGCVRGLKKTAANLSDADAALKKNFAVGTPVRLVTHSATLNNYIEADEDGTISGDLTFTGEVVFVNGMRLPAFADTTARDAALITPVAGDKCFLTDGTGEQNYNGATWDTLGVATPVTASLGVKKVGNDLQSDLATDPGLELNTNSLRVKTDATEGTINRTAGGISVNEAGSFDFTGTLKKGGAEVAIEDPGSQYVTGTTGLITTTTTADLVITLNDTKYTRFRVDVQVGSDESNSGTGGMTQRGIIEGATGGGILNTYGPTAQPVNLNTNQPFPYSFSTPSFSSSPSALSVSQSGGSGTASMILNSISIVGNELRINYTSRVDTPADSRALVKVINAIVYK